MNIGNVFATVILSLAVLQASAQETRDNRDRQPDWGPAGYEYAEFYYIPDMDVYYDVTRSVFRVEERGRWVEAAELPERFASYDIYSCYKVVINGREPWLNHRNHDFVYDRYRRKPFRQQTIRDSRSGNSEGERHNPKRDRRMRERELRKTEK